ncbi:hypothetical protein BJX76DRAFT_325883 [Aspergillus varians]
MQRLWSRSAPTAAPTSHCFSCLAEEVASRTASAANKRSLRVGNSITALYTSIFAAAVLTDARAKSRRRRDWEEKIAAVKEEVNELVDEERRLLSTLSSWRTAIPLRGTPQTRPFHTLPRPTCRNVQLPNTQLPRKSSHFSSNTAPFDELVESSVLKELESETVAPIEEDVEDFDMALDVEDMPHWLRTDLVRAKAIRKLALRQLSIRILLRPAIAHSYFGVLKNYDAEDAYPQLDMPGLLFELNAIRRRIRQIKANPTANIDDLAQQTRARRLNDKRIRHDTNLYLSNEMPLEELLLRLSTHLLEAQDPDQAYAFTMMIIAFTKTRQNDLAELVIKTILPYKFPLTSSLILAIVTFFRKSKNLKGFDLFLKMLEGEGYPVDMGNLGFYKKKVVNGVAISVPPVNSANVVTYATLIKACLRFDQPDRADAYLLAARAAGCMDDFAILMAYLEFYTIRLDWEKGLQVLQRALAYIASTTEHPLERVERLIMMIVQLCDSCHKLEVSEALIKAAVSSGFSADLPSQQTDIVSNVDPEFHRWWMAAQSSTAEIDQTMGDKCYAFAQSAKEYLDTLAITEEDSSARRLHRLMGTHSHQLLSSMVDGRITQRTAKKDNETEQARADGQLAESETENKHLSTSPEVMMAAQQQEIGVLRTEVARLKEMVLRLYQPVAAPTTSPDPNDLKKPIVSSTPASGETPQDKRVSTMGGS